MKSVLIFSIAAFVVILVSPSVHAQDDDLIMLDEITIRVETLGAEQLDQKVERANRIGLITKVIKI